MPVTLSGCYNLRSPSQRPASRAARPGSESHGFFQLRHDADGGQGRLLRPGPVREDDQPAPHLRPHRARLARRDGVAGDRDRPDAFLRPAAPRRRRHRRVQDAGPALHGPRPGLLQHDAQARAQGRRRHRLRGRLPARDAGRERRVPRESQDEPRRDRREARRDSARAPVQQARPRQHPLARGARRQPESRETFRELRSLRRSRPGRLRNPQGDLSPHAAFAQEENARRRESARVGARAESGSRGKDGRARSGRGSVEVRAEGRGQTDAP